MRLQGCWRTCGFVLRLPDAARPSAQSSAAHHHSDALQLLASPYGGTCLPAPTPRYLHGCNGTLSVLALLQNLGGAIYGAHAAAVHVSWASVCGAQLLLRCVACIGLAWLGLAWLQDELARYPQRPLIIACSRAQAPSCHACLPRCCSGAGSFGKVYKAKWHETLVVS